MTYKRGAILIQYSMIDGPNLWELAAGEDYNNTRRCNTSFKKFEQLRGRILSYAIAVERELDRTLAWYFVPVKEIDDIDALDVRRHEIFVDVMLGSESQSFGAKLGTLASIHAAVGITNPTVTKMRKTVEPVMTWRNKFAHRRVGVNWKTREVSLRDPKKRQWELLKPDLEETYIKICEEASRIIHLILAQIRDMQKDVS